MKKHNIIIRGELHFVTDGNMIKCWLGEPDNPESEFIFEVNKVFSKDIISGLTAINQHYL